MLYWQLWYALLKLACCGLQLARCFLYRSCNTVLSAKVSRRHC